MQRTRRGAQECAQLGVGVRLAIIAIDVLQQGRQPGECGFVDATMLRDALMRALLQLIERPARFRHSNDRDIQIVSLDEGLERGEDLLIRQVSRRSKKYDGIRFHTSFIA